MIGAMSPTVELANILAPVINVVFLLFGGSFLPAPPPWFIWLKWISPINYAYSSLAENQFAGQVYSSCDASSSTQCYPTVSVQRVVHGGRVGPDLPVPVRATVKDMPR
jgi:hypothetical protein